LAGHIIRATKRQLQAIVQLTPYKATFGPRVPGYTHLP